MLISDIELTNFRNYKKVKIKLNNGIPFTLKRREIIELNDGHGSYVCEYGHLHDYSKLNVNEMLKDIDEKTYNNVEELKKTLEEE